MVMSVLEDVCDAAQYPDKYPEQYPELIGTRVLITGLEPGHGVDIARAFAEAGCRLVLQTPAESIELDVVLETLARDATEVRVSSAAIPDEDAALRFAQSAVSAYGGLDVVVNLARLDDRGLSADATQSEIEDRLAATLGRPLKLTQVIANRMQLTWKEGLILNIVTQGDATTPAALHLGRIARAALSALTRREAARWANKAVRINAIVPAAAGTPAFGSDEPTLHSEPEIAGLALHLSSKKGKSLSGLVFDAAAG